MSADRDAQAQPEQRPEFPVLDTLRAFGALAVLTTHVAFQSGAYVRHGMVGALLSRLDVGVALFFVLSGFLLARPYLARAAVHAPFPTTRHYYWKRFVRIYPVYAVTVVIALLTIPENDFGGGLGQWVSSLTLTDVFVRARLPQGLTQMWSLSVEATFYLVLPLLMVAMLGRGRAPQGRRMVLVLGLGTLFSCWWNLDLAGAIAPHTDGVPLLWLPAHLTWFLVGIGLAAVHVAWQSGSRSRLVRGLVALGRMPGACWTAAAGVLVVAGTPLGGPIILLAATPTQSLTKHLLYAVFAALVLLTGVFALPRGHYSRIMSQPFLRHLGRISYSTFCIHLVVLYFVEEILDYRLFSGDMGLLWVLTLVASLIASELLYRFVEKPGLRLKERRGRRVTSVESPHTSTTAASTK